MSSIEWDPNAREFMRKLPRNISERIFKKVDEERRHIRDKTYFLF